MKITSLLYPVKNIEKSTQFFVENLGFEAIGAFGLSASFQEENIVKSQALQLGNEVIVLIQFEKNGNKIPLDSKSNDGWFQHLALVTEDVDETYKELSKKRIQHVSTFPQTLPEKLTHAAGVKAFYFQDEDRHPLELISFPPDKIKDKWKVEKDALLQGIDHTAIVVKDSDVSVKFYTELLGFELKDQNENYGTEQEHLNQLFGARLRISALSLGEGIDLELLEYIAPPGGRAYPENTRLNDIWAIQTVIQTTKNLDRFIRVKEFGGKVLNEERNRILIQDPDGHIIHIHN